MILNTDGGARGNPGPGAAGAVLKNNAGEIVESRGLYLGECTNNEAEYRALIMGIEMAKSRRAPYLTCYLDSELVVKQLNGEYRIKTESLRPFFTKIKELEKEFELIEYKHVKRKENKEADAIVNEVLDNI